MFFLGGFNTVIPYLLYLCVIWVFMIIGLSGRINVFWSHTIFSEGKQVEIQQNNINHPVNYVVSADHNDYAEREIQQHLLVYSVQTTEKIPPDDDSPFHKSLKSNLFRGPPLFS